MKIALRTFLLLFLAGAVTAHAEKPVNTTLFGVAIKGYDAVAFFTDGKPVSGNSSYVHAWNGAKWQFASAEHRDLFKATPEKYAPQYGGYCAWAVSQDRTANIDPAAWRIVDGKLYLNYSTDVQKMWEQDTPGNISKADKNWPGILRK